MAFKTQQRHSQLLKAIQERLDALEEDNVLLRLRCEDLEDENEHLKRTVQDVIGRMERQTNESIAKKEPRQLTLPPQVKRIKKTATVSPPAQRQSESVTPSPVMSTREKTTVSDSLNMPPRFKHNKTTANASAPGKQHKTGGFSISTERSTAKQATNHQKDAFVPPTFTKRELAKIESLCQRQDWDAILECLHQAPLLAHAQIFCGTTTLLHYTLNQAALSSSWKVIEYMLENTRDCLQMKEGSTGFLPLHTLCACNKLPRQKQHQYVMQMINAYPEAIAIQGGRWQGTPLHMVVNDDFPVEIVYAMLKRCPRAATIRDANGCLPIHVLCWQRDFCTSQKLTLLLNVCPQSILETTHADEDPFTIAVRSGQSRDVVDLLKRHMDGRGSPVTNCSERYRKRPRH